MPQIVTSNQQVPQIQNSLSSNCQALNKQSDVLDLKIQIALQCLNVDSNNYENNLHDNSQQMQKILQKRKVITKSKTSSKKKCRAQKKDKVYVAKQYPRQEPSIKCKYIQKNFELNIINQSKSASYILPYLKCGTKIMLFYSYMKIIYRFSKHYINKEYLKCPCSYQPQHIAYKMVTKDSGKLKHLSMQQFSKCARYLISVYLHKLCPQAKLTSIK